MTNLSLKIWLKNGEVQAQFSIENINPYQTIMKILIKKIWKINLWLLISFAYGKIWWTNILLISKKVKQKFQEKSNNKAIKIRQKSKKDKNFLMKIDQVLTFLILFLD